MNKILIIQTSLNKNSKTWIFCEKTLKIWKDLWLNIEVLDLREYKIEMCDWRKIEEYNEDMNKIKNILEKSDTYILAYPIYNYSFSWVCKNFIDIFSHCMSWKRCWIIQNSYSSRSFSDGFWELSKILSLHDKISIILPLVHTCNEDFDWNELVWEKSLEKIRELLFNINQ